MSSRQDETNVFPTKLRLSMERGRHRRERTESYCQGLGRPIQNHRSANLYLIVGLKEQRRRLTQKLLPALPRISGLGMLLHVIMFSGGSEQSPPPATPVQNLTTVLMSAVSAWTAVRNNVKSVRMIEACMIAVLVCLSSELRM